MAHPGDMLLGSGAFSNVYRRIMPGGRRIAVKVFKQPFAVPDNADQQQHTENGDQESEEDEQVLNMRWEARVFTVLGHHPNIVKFFGFVNYPVRGCDNGEFGGHKWRTELYMELAPQGTLLAFWKRTYPRLSPSTRVFMARWYMKQLLTGISHMHAKGFVHLDIKPDNLLVFDDCRIKIGDLGLSLKYPSQTKDDALAVFAHIPHDAELRAGERPDPMDVNQFVTIDFRPPELMLGALSFGPEVDSWSAGCVFWHLLTGCAAESFLPNALPPSGGLLNCAADAYKLVGVPPGADRSMFWKDMMAHADAKTTSKFEPAPTLDQISEASAVDTVFNTVMKVPLRSTLMDVAGACAGTGVFDLLLRLLYPDARQRILPAEALEHPCLKSITADMEQYAKLELLSAVCKSQAPKRARDTLLFTD